MVSNEFLMLSVTNTLYYYRLQQTYTKSVKQLGETGFGLVTNGWGRLRLRREAPYSMFGICLSILF